MGAEAIRSNMLERRALGLLHVLEQRLLDACRSGRDPEGARGFLDPGRGDDQCSDRWCGLRGRAGALGARPRAGFRLADGSVVVARLLPDGVPRVAFATVAADVVAKLPTTARPTIARTEASGSMPDWRAAETLCRQALELAEAAGGDATALGESAQRALRDAGDRASQARALLDAAAARAKLSGANELSVSKYYRYRYELDRKS